LTGIPNEKGFEFAIINLRELNFTKKLILFHLKLVDTIFLKNAQKE
jgi:hypothetical protein